MTIATLRNTATLEAMLANACDERGDYFVFAGKVKGAVQLLTGEALRVELTRLLNDLYRSEGETSLKASRRMRAVEARKYADEDGE